MGSNRTDIRYDVVERKINSIERKAEGTLKGIANTRYKDLQAACQASKGDYAGAVQEVLERERKDVVAIADFMVKLQKMIGQVSKDYQQTDSAYKKKGVTAK